MAAKSEVANSELHTTAADVCNGLMHLAAEAIAPGHEISLRAAKKFTQQDVTMVRTFDSIKQLAAPLQHYQNQMQAIADSSMTIAVSQQKIRKCLKSTMTSSHSHTTPVDMRTSSSGRASQAVPRTSQASAVENFHSSSLDQWEQTQRSRNLGNSAAAEAARSAEEAAEAAQVQLLEAEAAMDSEDMAAIEALIADVDDGASVLEEAYKEEEESRSQRYTVDYYKSQAEGTVVKPNYSGKYKQIMERQALEARERAELERMDVENRAIGARAAAAEAKLAAAEAEMSLEDKMAIEAIIAGGEVQLPGLDEDD